MSLSAAAQVVMEAMRILDGEGIDLDDVGLRRPTLYDVFLAPTGHSTAEIAAADEAALVE